MKNLSSRTIALSGTLTALAMVFSYVEAMIPVFASIPGFKIGLANIAIVFALYRLGFKKAMEISVIRVILSTLLFSNALSLIYSLSAAVISLIVMAVMKKGRLFSSLGVSVCGAVSHNLIQILVAVLLFNTKELVYLLPLYVISGTIAGIVIGILSSVILERTKGLGYEGI
ncbi:MAG: Gx transporter family protein [Sphaerochaetaceae bacterium]|nr:Gx transporter family protein [Sphaerochaetaceae bacterium]